mmetsp:Transcript_43796/g.139598  ORF Transcript_43796/g.139598 Transcript_43796/m.139598 type:complete len:310 (-) Transcript_43796:543-1472(-)
MTMCSAPDSSYVAKTWGTRSCFPATAIIVSTSLQRYCRRSELVAILLTTTSRYGSFSSFAIRTLPYCPRPTSAFNSQDLVRTVPRPLFRLGISSRIGRIPIAPPNPGIDEARSPAPPRCTVTSSGSSLNDTSGEVVAEGFVSMSSSMTVITLPVFVATLRGSAFPLPAGGHSLIIESRTCGMTSMHMIVMSSCTPRSLITARMRSVHASSGSVMPSPSFCGRQSCTTFSLLSAPHSPSDATTMRPPPGGTKQKVTSGVAMIESLQSLSPIARVTATPPGYTRRGPTSIPFLVSLAIRPPAICTRLDSLW